MESWKPLTLREAQLLKDKKTIRIYTDGVYDLFHPGHIEQLRQAKQAFPSVHLIVGVCSDADTLEFKKCLPIMNEDERVNMIKQCKFVDEVCESPPFFPTVEFVDSLQADLVAHDAIPYTSPDSFDCYKIFKVSDRFLETKRTPAISTTTLLNRILNNLENIQARQIFKNAIDNQI
uniref:Choline-phosphate cytidylyltransferase n=1 Tax=Panagrolaimus sp. JU765 TaxID=591449 RepID=A0AC34Q2D4_9BILA